MKQAKSLLVDNRTILKNKQTDFYYMCVGVLPAGLSVYHVHVWFPRDQKRVLGSLELDLRVVGCHVIKLQSSRGGTSALGCSYDHILKKTQTATPKDSTSDHYKTKSQIHLRIS